MFNKNDLIEIIDDCLNVSKGWRGYVCGYFNGLVVLKQEIDKCVIGGPNVWVQESSCKLITPVSEFNTPQLFYRRKWRLNSHNILYTDLPWYTSKEEFDEVWKRSENPTSDEWEVLEVVIRL